MLLGITALSAFAWGFLLLAWGGFWRADQRLPPDLGAKNDQSLPLPVVAIVIPARDEAAVISASISAHMGADYAGSYKVLLVDDSSADGTAAIAAEAARGGPLTILSAPPLAPGWTGKLWALHHGIEVAMASIPAPKYILLADADIVAAPGTLRRLVMHAEAGELGLVSLMSRLDGRGVWGGLLIPAFVFFFQKLYPFRWVNDPDRRTAAAAGGCALVNARDLQSAGGVAAIRGRLIDDCSLAALIKNGPPRKPIWLGLADNEAVSRRDNRQLDSIWHMVSRTAFDQLNRSWLLVAISIAGMGLVYLIPPLIALGVAVHGDVPAAAMATIAYLCASLAYWPTARLYGRRPAFTLTLPIAAALYMAMTIASGIAHMRGEGGRWKGRTYAH